MIGVVLDENVMSSRYSCTSIRSTIQCHRPTLGLHLLSFDPSFLHVTPTYAMLYFTQQSAGLLIHSTPYPPPLSIDY
jgi:hypothetical protein